MLTLHDLDCAYCDQDSTEYPGPSYMDEAHWLNLDYCGDDYYFIEASMIDSRREEVTFYMSRKTAKTIRDYLTRMLRK